MKIDEQPFAGLMYFFFLKYLLQDLLGEIKKRIKKIIRIC